MFGSQTYNLQPDIMTLAKALSSGYADLRQPDLGRL
jgi:adenosylmethionine-8-amino-7-oxononanoate aminotransferase